MTEVIDKRGILERISSEYRYLAEQLKLPAGEFVPHLYADPAAEAKALARLAELGIAPGGYAVLAPFTTRPQKHWFEDAWQELAPRLSAELDLVPVMLGGPGDREGAARIAPPGSAIVDLTGTTRLAESAALIKHAGLVVGVDTGLTHMGIAFARPTVAVFGSTRPYLDTGRPNARVIWLNLPCSPEAGTVSPGCDRPVRPPSTAEDQATHRAAISSCRGETGARAAREGGRDRQDRARAATGRRLNQGLMRSGVSH